MSIQENSSLTYRRLRRAIGFLGISLPITLIIASLFKPWVSFQVSISHYYYTNMRDIFTGILCAVGLFLIRYKGFGNKQWWKNDNLLTNIAGVMAFGVALFPTSPPENIRKIYTLVTINEPWLNYLHFGFAATLFIAFAILSLFVFTLGQNRDPGVPKSIMDENNIYRTCGILIFVFIILVPVTARYLPSVKYSTFFLEMLSLFAFGISWLIKGRALGDTGMIGEKLYGERNIKAPKVDAVAGDE